MVSSSYPGQLNIPDNSFVIKSTGTVAMDIHTSLPRLKAILNNIDIIKSPGGVLMHASCYPGQPNILSKDFNIKSTRAFALDTIASMPRLLVKAWKADHAY